MQWNTRDRKLWYKIHGLLQLGHMRGGNSNIHLRMRSNLCRGGVELASFPGSPCACGEEKYGGGEPGTLPHVMSWHVDITAIMTSSVMSQLERANVCVSNIIPMATIAWKVTRQYRQLGIPVQFSISLSYKMQLTRSRLCGDENLSPRIEELQHSIIIISFHF